MAVTASWDVLGMFQRTSLYNSPYEAHRRGRAIDLYPGSQTVPSPVSGRVQDIRQVSVPDRPYARSRDTLVLVDTGTHIARLLHVEPFVTVGDEIGLGEPLGRTIRSGWFAPWVAGHVHLEWRPPEADQVRASGGLPVELDIPLVSCQWDGTGVVIERAPSYVVLDRPTHPDPGATYAGLAADGGGVLDGGIAHYERGGRLGSRGGPVSVLGEQVGQPIETDRSTVATVAWHPLRVFVDGEAAGGLSCVLARDRSFGATIVEPPDDIGLGDRVSVTIETHEQER